MNDKLKQERSAFDYERSYASLSPSHPFIKDIRGWLLLGPLDIREGVHEYQFALQQLKGQKEPRVRVGCRYYTLAAAWRHWSFKARTGKSSRRGSYGRTNHKNEGKQAIAIIRLMLLQAQAYGLLSLYKPVPKFDSALIKRKQR